MTLGPNCALGVLVFEASGSKGQGKSDHTYSGFWNYRNFKCWVCGSVAC